jgi:hypothetical protein
MIGDFRNSIRNDNVPPLGRRPFRQNRPIDYCAICVS